MRAKSAQVRLKIGFN
jgi:hypothetical protein